MLSGVGMAPLRKTGGTAIVKGVCEKGELFPWLRSLLREMVESGFFLTESISSLSRQKMVCMRVDGAYSPLVWCMFVHMCLVETVFARSCMFLCKIHTSRKETLCLSLMNVMHDGLVTYRGSRLVDF